MSVISFSYFIPEGGPGKTEAIAQETPVQWTECFRPSSRVGGQIGEAATRVLGGIFSYLT